MPTRKSMYNLIVFMSWFISIASGYIIQRVPRSIETMFPMVIKLKIMFLICAIGITLFVIARWCIQHRIWNGLIYAFSHALLKKRIRKQLYDDHIYTIGYFFSTEVADLPKIMIRLEE